MPQSIVTTSNADLSGQEVAKPLAPDPMLTIAFHHHRLIGASVRDLGNEHSFRRRAVLVL